MPCGYDAAVPAIVPATVLLSLLACAPPHRPGGDGDTGTEAGEADGGAPATCGEPDTGDALEDLHASTEATWAAVAAGSQHGCGLHAGTGEVECWGYDWDGRATVPDLGMAAVDLVAGADFTCALLQDGSPRCWGEQTAVLTDLPAGPFVDLDGGYDFACALDAAGAATCWGDDEHGQLQVQGGPYVALSAGRTHACGLDAAGSLTCWGAQDSPKPGPPHEGELVDHGQAEAPAGTFLAVDAGDYHTCAIDLEGTATCWGRDRAGETRPPTAVAFSDLAAGGVHTCGVSDAGQACCWGADSATWDYHQAVQPPGTFTEVEASSVFTCGLRQAEGGSGTNAGLELACWGALGDLPVQVP